VFRNADTVAAFDVAAETVVGHLGAASACAGTATSAAVAAHPAANKDKDFRTFMTDLS
jgi:hypothetical protein